MADLENENLDMEKPGNESGENSESGPVRKPAFLKIVIPVILAQIVLAYFLAKTMIVPVVFDESDHREYVAAGQADINTSDNVNSDFGLIHKLEDIIVNPSQSAGGQFVLINLALEVTSGADIEVLKKREVQARDILIRLISGKTIAELDGPDDKEKLRAEILAQIGGLLPENHLRNVYFANYIIQ